MNMMQSSNNLNEWIWSIHEGEPIFVLFGDLCIEFFSEIKLSLLLIVLFQSWLNEYSCGYNCSDALPQWHNLQEVGCFVQSVQFSHI